MRRYRGCDDDWLIPALMPRGGLCSTVDERRLSGDAIHDDRPQAIAFPGSLACPNGLCGFFWPGSIVTQPHANLAFAWADGLLHEQDCLKGTPSRRKAMYVADILKAKGTRVVTITSNASMQLVAQCLRTERIGALVVSETGTTADGIISERDLARGLAEHGAEVLS